jgi:hypothetical protein
MKIQILNFNDMKIIKLLSVIFLILFLFSSCKEKTTQNPSVSYDVNGLTEIDIDSDSKTEILDNLMDSVFFIKLETTNDNLIGQIDQLLLTQDKIVVLDARKARTITVYDMNGHFLNRIGNLGQGPQDYSFLSHIALSPDSSMLIVPDLGSLSLKYYTLDGKFVKSVNSPYRFGHCEFLADSLIVGSDGSGNTLPNHAPSYRPILVTTDLSGNVSYSAFQSYYSDHFYLSSPFALRRFDTTILYNPLLSDTIYQVFPDRLSALYHLNIKGAKPIRIDENTTDDQILDIHSGHPWFNGDVIELKDAAVFYICNNSGTPMAFYSKRKRQTYMCNWKYSNPLYLFYNNPSARYKDNTIVVSVAPEYILSLKRLVYEKSFWGDRKTIEDLYKDLNDDDNPVLFFFRVSI